MIKFHTFVEWLQLPRRVDGARRPLRFQEISLATAPNAVALFEVMLPGGLIVRGDNAARVAELVRALRT